MKRIRALLVLMAMCLCFSVAACGGPSGETHDGVKTYTVKFDLCTNLRTNTILDRVVEDGGYVDKPSVAIRGENPENLELVGWYEDKEYISQWDFNFDTVVSDMTLYAKWESRFTVKYYIGEKIEPVLTKIVKKERTVEPISDETFGYEVFGYYKDREYTEKFDFGTPIVKDTEIFIKVSRQAYLDANDIENRFTPVAGGDVADGATVGSISHGERTLENGETETYARVDFGYSVTATPYVSIQYVDIDITGSQSLELICKNLGDAYQIKLYWIVKDEFGSYLGKDKFDESNSVRYSFIGKDSERNMSEDDDWLTLKFDLAQENENWRNASTLTSFRIDASYNSKDHSQANLKCKEETVDNILLIKEIRGIYDETYDSAKELVTYHCGDDVFTSRVAVGDKLVRNESILLGYKPIAYYTDAALTEEYDFDTEITGPLDLYVKTEDYFWLGAESIVKYFKIANSSDTSLELSDDGEYAIVNFGTDPLPQLIIQNYSILKQNSDKIQLVLKNLSPTKQFAFVYKGLDENGEQVYLTNSEGKQEQWVDISGDFEKADMSADDDDLVVTLDLSSNKDKAKAWAQLVTINGIIIQSKRSGATADNLCNVWYLKEIRGCRDENAGKEEVEITYHLDGKEFSSVAYAGDKLVRDDSLYLGYKVVGYYMDAGFTEEYDFDTEVVGDMTLYVKAEDYFWLGAKDIVDNFRVASSTNSSLTLSEDGEYAIVNFGVGDFPLLLAENLSLVCENAGGIQIVLKNLSGTDSYAFVWRGKNANGEFAFEGWADKSNNFGQKDMSASDDELVITIDLSDNEKWTDSVTIASIGFQSKRSGATEDDLSNVWYIKEIKGIA